MPSFISRINAGVGAGEFLSPLYSSPPFFSWEELPAWGDSGKSRFLFPVATAFGSGLWLNFTPVRRLDILNFGGSFLTVLSEAVVRELLVATPMGDDSGIS